MPAPAAVYIVAVVASVAAGVAFHQFVYEPHIAPKLEAWAEDFLSRRAAKRERQQVRVPASSSESPQQDGRKNSRKSSRNGEEHSKDLRSSTYELEDLISNEVQEWRSGVQRSHGAAGSSLRHRKQVSSSNELDKNYEPMSPTHIIFDSSCPSTPSTSRSGTLRQSKLPQNGRLPTPDPSIAPRSPPCLPANLSNTASPLADVVDLEVLSPRSPSPFSVVYGSSTASSASPEQPLSPVQQVEHPLSPVLSSSLSYVTPTNGTHNEALSELEFLSSSSGSDNGRNPFSGTDEDDMFSASSHASDDDFDIRSTSSWASARAST